MYFVLYTFMEDIDVYCFVYVYGGYRCILFSLRSWRISTDYVCLRVCGISMYFLLSTFMDNIDVICFVYIYGGYRCNLFCLHL